MRREQTDRRGQARVMAARWPDRRLLAAAAAVLALALTAAQPLAVAHAASAAASADSAAHETDPDLPLFASGGAVSAVGTDGSGGLLATDGSAVQHAPEGEAWMEIFDLLLHAPDLVADGATVRALTGSADGHLLLVASDEVVGIFHLDGDVLQELADVSCLAACSLAAADDSLYLLSDEGVSASSDGGTTWDEVRLPDDAGVPTALTTDGSALVVATATHLLHSGDGGASFETVDRDLPEAISSLVAHQGQLLTLVDGALLRTAEDVLPPALELDDTEAPDLDDVAEELPSEPVDELVEGDAVHVGPVIEPVEDADGDVAPEEVDIEAPGEVAPVDVDPTDTEVALELPTPPEADVVEDAEVAELVAMPDAEPILIGARPAGEEAEEVVDDEPIEETPVEEEPVEDDLVAEPSEPVVPAGVTPQRPHQPGPEPVTEVAEVAAGALSVEAAPPTSTVPTATQLTASFGACALLVLLALGLAPRLSPACARILGLAPRR